MVASFKTVIIFSALVASVTAGFCWKDHHCDEGSQCKVLLCVKKDGENSATTVSQETTSSLPTTPIEENPLYVDIPTSSPDSTASTGNTVFIPLNENTTEISSTTVSSEKDENEIEIE